MNLGRNTEISVMPLHLTDMAHMMMNGQADVTPCGTHPQTHDLKIAPEYFAAVSDGRKKFELRKNDRGFETGDLLVLREWTGGGYTGRSVRCRVDHILSGYDGLDPGYAILSITLL